MSSPITPDVDVTSEAHDVPKMVAAYKKLFTILVGVTILGIGLAYLHMSPWIAVIIGIVIITFKSAILVDAFKPLLTGRWMLLMTFGLTLIFFIALLLLPLMNHHMHITGTEDTGREMDAPSASGHNSGADEVGSHQHGH